MNFSKAAFLGGSNWLSFVKNGRLKRFLERHRDFEVVPIRIGVLSFSIKKNSRVFLQKKTSQLKYKCKPKSQSLTYLQIGIFNIIKIYLYRFLFKKSPLRSRGERLKSQKPVIEEYPYCLLTLSTSIQNYQPSIENYVLTPEHFQVVSFSRFVQF